MGRICWGCYKVLAEPNHGNEQCAPCDVSLTTIDFCCSFRQASDTLVELRGWVEKLDPEDIQQIAEKYSPVEGLGQGLDDDSLIPPTWPAGSGLLPPAPGEC